MEAFSRAVEIAAAVAVLFLYPIISFGQKEALILELALKVYTAELTDGIRTHGYLTGEEYEAYLAGCTGFGAVCGIRIEAVGWRYDEAAGIWYERLVTHEEIMEEIVRNGYAGFSQGDSLMISVEAHFAGAAGMLYRMGGTEGVRIETGGVIRDETEPVYSAVP